MHLADHKDDANRAMLDNRWTFTLGIEKLRSHHYLKEYNEEYIIKGLTYNAKPFKCKVFKQDIAKIYAETDSSSWNDSDCEPLASLISNL